MRGMDLARPRTALALLCAASFLAVVDTTIVSIALPAIRRAMNFTATGSQWVLNAYPLVFGGLLLLFGRLGDRLDVAGCSWPASLSSSQDRLWPVSRSSHGCSWWAEPSRD